MSSPTPIDLDQNATSPLDDDVLDAMRLAFQTGGNPESQHGGGRAARRLLEQARETVAAILDADPDEVHFTSGGTEANNTAVLGLARNQLPGLVVASHLEHPAVAEPLARLVGAGFSLKMLAVTPEGQARVEAISPDVRLATLMLAQNETGALQPVRELAASCASLGIPVHTDAVQAVGRVPVRFHDLGVTTLAASGHKLHGPPGVGLLLVRRGTTMVPLLVGGGQERGVRAGTVPVPLCVGLACALEKWHVHQAERARRWGLLRERLAQGLLAGLGPEGVVIQGPSLAEQVLPQTLHAGFPGLDGALLLMRLDLAGVRVSLGSACASGAPRVSPALAAMGLPADRLRSSVRFSFGAMTTSREIDEAVERTVRIAREPRQTELV